MPRIWMVAVGLFANQPGLRSWLVKRLANPRRSQTLDRGELLATAADCDGDVNRLAKLQAELDARRRHRAREIKRRSETLQSAKVSPHLPEACPRRSPMLSGFAGGAGLFMIPVRS